MRILSTFIIVFAMSVALESQASSRQVNLSWSASTSVSVIGYNVYKCTAPCTPSSSSASLNGATPVASLSFTDAALTGLSYVYGVVAVAPPCTASTPVTSACGVSAIAISGTVSVPPTPASGGTIIIVVP